MNLIEFGEKHKAALNAHQIAAVEALEDTATRITMLFRDGLPTWFEVDEPYGEVIAKIRAHHPVDWQYNSFAVPCGVETDTRLDVKIHELMNEDGTLSYSDAVIQASKVIEESWAEHKRDLLKAEAEMEADECDPKWSKRRWWPQSAGPSPNEPATAPTESHDEAPMHDHQSFQNVLDDHKETISDTIRAATGNIPPPGPPPPIPTVDIPEHLTSWPPKPDKD